MAETLKRHRESAAWLVLAVGIGYILISLVRLGHSMVGGASFAAAARGVGGSSLGVPMVLVCNGGLRMPTHPLVRLQIVSAGPDESDKWIADSCGPGDVVVTGDLPLADRCIKAGAAVLTQASPFQRCGSMRGMCFWMTMRL